MKSLGAIAAMVLVIGATSCDKPAGNQTSQQQLSNEEMVKRGKYIVTVSACHDCHSPKVFTPQGPQLDTTRLLSGHPQNEQTPPISSNTSPEWTLFSPGLTAFKGVWGMSYAANLTPDDTGIGAWDFEQFERAIRKGKYKGLEGSRQLLPPMPWEMYKNFTDADLRAVFAYLKSLKPVDNLVPSPLSPDKLQSLTISNK